MKKKVSVFKNLNKWILFITLALSIMGALLILDASSISSVLRYHNSSPYYFFIRQLIMLGIGYAGALIIIKFPTRLYREFLDYSNKLYLTEIDAECKDADVYFPTFNHDEWDSEVLKENEDDGIRYKHVLYKRKNRI